MYSLGGLPTHTCFPLGALKKHQLASRHQIQMVSTLCWRHKHLGHFRGARGSSCPKSLLRSLFHMGHALVCQAAMVGYHGLDDLSNKDFFFATLEARGPRSVCRGSGSSGTSVYDMQIFMSMVSLVLTLFSLSLFWGPHPLLLLLTPCLVVRAWLHNFIFISLSS